MIILLASYTVLVLAVFAAVATELAPHFLFPFIFAFNDSVVSQNMFSLAQLCMNLEFIVCMRLLDFAIEKETPQKEDDKTAALWIPFLRCRKSVRNKALC